MSRTAGIGLFCLLVALVPSCTPPPGASQADAPRPGNPASTATSERASLAAGSSSSRPVAVLDSPVIRSLTEPFAKRVEFGKETGVYLEVTRDSADAAGLLLTPATIAAGISGSGLAPPVAPLLLTCRPLAAGQKKRVLLKATVCLRSGFLEHLLSHGGKKHESVLFADVDSSIVHAALLAAGAKPGSPVQFQNLELKRAFRPASGEHIRITLQYEENGLRKTVPAQNWIRYAKTQKKLDQDWVFAGSYTFKDPDGAVIYAACEGRYICVTNFSNAMLDLPFKSQDGDPQNGLDFEANTEQIPPQDTPVLVILEPTGTFSDPKAK